MFEEDDKQEKYEAFAYDSEEELNLSESYAKRMLQKRQLERKQRKGNIWISRLHVFLRLIILAGLIYGFYRVVKLPQWYINQNIFTVPSSNLEIVNNKIVPTFKILNELRKIPVASEPIYKFETDKVKVSLLELEPIEDVYIRRYWYPARLQIIVKERIPILSIYTDENSPSVAFYTQDGVLVGPEYLPLPENMQTIKVITTGNLKEWDTTKIDSIKKIVEYIEQLTSGKVEYIDLRNENDIYAQTPIAKLRIGGLDDGIYDRVSRLTSVLPNLKKIVKPVKYIDLRWRNTVYVKTEGE